MEYGRSPGRDRWHRIAGQRTLCHHGRGGGNITPDWLVSDRLPPRHDHHCELCFPWHVPPVDTAATTPGGWDLDGFIGTL